MNRDLFFITITASFGGLLLGFDTVVTNGTLGIPTEADLTWSPTTIIRGPELVQTISDLRSEPGGDIYVYGSLTLVRTLLTAQLVDELVLIIEPITLGGGKTLFPSDGEARRFQLTGATP